MQVRVLRGRGADPAVDRAETATLLERTAGTGTPAVRVWAPHRQVAFGRRDTHAEGYELAREAAERRGFPSLERSVGGHAVAYTGRTLAFARAVPIADLRRGLDERYESTTAAVLAALSDLGADVERGEPDRSYCPGAHSIRAVGGGKLVGVAQRVRSGAALVSGCVTVATADEPAIRRVLEPVYDALDVPFDPASVDSVAGAGGPENPTTVARAIERALVGDADATVESVGSAGPPVDADPIHDT
ncbi:lipoate--protein ligase family protein [Haloferacaceae archaeon DSL9]